MSIFSMTENLAQMKLVMKLILHSVFCFPVSSDTDTKLSLQHCYKHWTRYERLHHVPPAQWPCLPWTSPPCWWARGCSSVAVPPPSTSPPAHLGHSTLHMVNMEGQGLGYEWWGTKLWRQMLRQSFKTRAGLRMWWMPLLGALAQGP